MKNVIFLTATALCITIIGCAVQPNIAKTTKSVKYSGGYNTISGKLSDNSVLKGVAWFNRNTFLGDFCVQAKDMVCSGKYSSEGELTIIGKFECSNQTNGSFTVRRKIKGDFVVPLDGGTANFSDGRKATINFGPSKTGSGMTICYK